jgi:hypothetical protein
MPHPMSTAMLAAIQSPQLFLAFFVQMTFQSGTVYVWTGSGPITWNGQTWLGSGKQGSISTIEEGATVEARGVSLTLSGIDSTLLPDVMTEFALLQPVTVYLGLFAGGSLIASPVTSWAGRMDQPTVDVDGATSEITINCESRLLDMNTTCGRRYTQEDQQRDWPGDQSMMFAPFIADINLYWGSAPTSSPNV